MTMARIQPLCRAHKLIVGYFDETKVFPRLVADRINALFLHILHNFV